MTNPQDTCSVRGDKTDPRRDPLAWLRKASQQEAGPRKVRKKPGKAAQVDLATAAETSVGVICLIEVRSRERSTSCVLPISFGHPPVIRKAKCRLAQLGHGLSLGFLQRLPPLLLANGSAGHIGAHSVPSGRVTLDPVSVSEWPLPDTPDPLAGRRYPPADRSTRFQVSLLRIDADDHRPCRWPEWKGS